MTFFHYRINMVMQKKIKIREGKREHSHG
jgi:hypothetical protein